MRVVALLLSVVALAGCTLVLIWSFTELGTPLIFQFYDITPVQVFHQITDVHCPGGGANAERVFPE